MLRLSGNRKIQIKFGIHVREWGLEFFFQQFPLVIIWSNRNQLQMAFAPNHTCVRASFLVLECLITYNRKYCGLLVHIKYCEAFEHTPCVPFSHYQFWTIYIEELECKVLCWRNLFWEKPRVFMPAFDQPCEGKGCSYCTVSLLSCNSCAQLGTRMSLELLIS